MITQNNKLHLEKLKNTIYSQLDGIIDRDYVLLDIPDHENVGDELIWEGELEYLKRLEFKNLYTSNLVYFSKKKVSKDALILLHGGGNFGDIYKGSSRFRRLIVSNFGNNKIIIFPQTVFYSSEELLKKDAELFNKHSNLTICARDHVSYEILKKYFHGCKILLVPDMAFCLDYSNRTNDTTTGKSLFLKRIDSELKKVNYVIPEPHDLADWPSFADEFKKKMVKQIGIRYFKLERLYYSVLFHFPALRNVFSVSMDNAIKRKDYYINFGIEFLNQYDRIYSTRLHCTILGLLLGKDVKILDNSYGKNSNFYKSWLTGFDNCELLNY